MRSREGVPIEGLLQGIGQPTGCLCCSAFWDLLWVKLLPLFLAGITLIMAATADGFQPCCKRAILLGVHSDSDRPEGVNTTKYIIGFFCTIAASAIYGLILPLMQLVFDRVIKKETFAVVLEMQIYTSLVATVVCVVGLFVSGEFRDMKEEAHSFTKGRVAYYMTLIWSAIGWQVCSVGVVGLIFLVSSLFSNVISTLALPVVPILSVGFFHDKMDSLKIISMLLSIWGFVSYIFGGYVDSKSSSTKNASRED